MSAALLLGHGTEIDARYARSILRDWRVEKTPQLLGELQEMTDNIFNCPKRCHGRTYEQVASAVKKSVMDRALCDLTGFRHNSGDFDVTDPDTYSYDAEDVQRRVRFEVKSFRERWLSWRGRAMSTFLKHSAEIGYLVSGKMWESSDDFRGSFLLLARAETFDRFIKESMTPGTRYYHHKLAGQEGQAIYRKEIA